MAIRKCTVLALVLGVAVCSSLGAGPADARFGMGYVLLGADGKQTFFPGSAVELRLLPLKAFGSALLGVDVRLAEDLSFAYGQTGEVDASIRLAGAFPSGDTARLSVFLGPSIRVLMDPSYGSMMELGGVLGAGAELFLASPCSVGLDLGVAVSSFESTVRFRFFGELLARFYLF